MNNMPLISVIVPIYNTERYLPRCLDSIISQSFTDFELLLVDDGSTDKSGAICDAYAEKNGGIRVFHKENGGVSSARNYGINNAQGDWLYFIDSDDELLPDGLRTLVDNISNEVDVVMGGYEKYDVNGKMVEVVGNTGNVVVMSKKESIISLYHGHALKYYYLGWMWIRMFRNSIVQSEKISFDTSLRIKEDTLFTTQYLCKSNGITRFVERPVYKYMMRIDSAMGGWRKGFDLHYIDSFYAMLKMKKEITNYFSPFNNVIFVAKEGVWIRYNRIVEKAKEFGFEDVELMDRLYFDMIKELGFSFFAWKRIKNMKKKWLQ